MSDIVIFALLAIGFLFFTAVGMYLEHCKIKREKDGNLIVVHDKVEGTYMFLELESDIERKDILTLEIRKTNRS